MRHFDYRDGALFAEDVDMAMLAAAVETPFYCYSAATIRRHIQVFSDAFAGLDALVCYAVKANSNLAVLRLLAREGAGMDVVSGGELARALAAGAPAEKITFSGVGKTDAEIAAALTAGIFCFNVESEPELESISRVASALGRCAHISLRVNPDVDARTHAKISTGRAENKFGVPLSHARAVYARAASLPGSRLQILLTWFPARRQRPSRPALCMICSEFIVLFLFSVGPGESVVADFARLAFRAHARGSGDEGLCVFGLSWVNQTQSARPMRVRPAGLARGACGPAETRNVDHERSICNLDDHPASRRSCRR